MPNSPIRRFESCYMPPKKFAWRFDSTNSAESSATVVQETANSSALNEEKHGMGLIFDEEMKSKQHAEQSSLAEKPLSPVSNSSIEDAPLDFSVKNHVRGSSNGLSDPSNKSLKEDEFKRPLDPSSYSDYVKRIHHMHLMAFPGMPQDRKSPTSVSNGDHGSWFSSDNAWNKHDAQPHNSGYQSASKTDSSENPDECKISVSINRLNGGTMYRSSPEQNLTTKNSPSKGISILQGMLSQDNAANKTSSKIQNVHISTTSESHQSGNSNELVNTVSPIMATPNQQILPHLFSSVNNIVPLPLTTFPYMNGMSYIRPSVLSGGLLSQGSEVSVLQALTQRRARRKKSEERPFKSYPIDILEEKLQSVSANAFGLEYSKKVMANGMASRSPPSDPGSRDNMNESPEHANGSINPSPISVTNGADNPSNAHCSGDSNDSLPVTETAEATSCTNNRKRKSTADADKDDAYWDRRRKNNLAAKRSREARRRKEDAIANMAILYETQNMDLQQNVAALTYKLNEATEQLARLIREHESVIIQNNILQERLSQKRCGHCGTQLPNIN